MGETIMDYKLLFENVKLHRLFLIVAIPSIISMVVSGSIR